jgi:hypothetical protein
MDAVTSGANPNCFLMPEVDVFYKPNCAMSRSQNIEYDFIQLTNVTATSNMKLTHTFDVSRKEIIAK